MESKSIYKDNQNNTSTYIYHINSKPDEINLCNLELKSLLDFVPEEHYFLSSLNLDISRSVYLRSKIEVLCSNSTLEGLESEVRETRLAFDNYKIIFVKTPDTIEFKKRLEAVRLIGTAIKGKFSINNPVVDLALIKLNDTYFFGHYIRNLDSWTARKHKPYNYSHAFSVKLAKTIINIAIGNNFDFKVIDPCCGIGTILIEGRVIGANIVGYEINPLIAEHCNENLRFMGFEGDVKTQDMHEITDKFDVAILDIPYGHFSTITPDEQAALITKSSQISTKVVIISMEDITDMINSVGCTIIDSCLIKKSNAFKRYIYICN